MRNRILTICLLVALSMGSSQAFGATPKAGGTCTKVGLKSGSLICTKINGKLRWQIVKKIQTIKYSAPKQASIADRQVNVSFTATSKLVVIATALTPNVCTMGKSVILFSGTPGLCRFSLRQNGNIYYLAANSVVVEVKVYSTNLIDFRLPGALLLSQGTFPLSATSSSNLAVTLTSATTSICTITDSLLNLLQAGICTVVATQSGADFVPEADSVTQSVEISTVRVTADLPDTFAGFQIKPVYVVPSDATDNAYDTNGYLTDILDEGNSYLQSQIGYSVPIDRTIAGYDIQYLKSQYSTEYLRTHEAAAGQSSDASVLLTEIKAMENPGDNRKDYIFFIEVPGFEAQYCGYAATPGNSAVIALQNVSDTGTCRGASALPFRSYTSKTWIHELIHNFGVDHTPDDPCDLMYGGGGSARCPADAAITIDKEGTRYVGTSSSQGPNIVGLRVWQGYTQDLSRNADCILNPVARVDGIGYAYCPTGTRPIGELTYCWSGVDSVSLEEMVGGVWVLLGTGNYNSKLWGGDLSGKACGDPNYPVAVWKEVTVDTPGIRHYRWTVNGQIMQMNVIWVK